MGPYVGFLIAHFPFRDHNGHISKIAGIAMDITERKRVEEELDKYRCHLEKLVEERTDRLVQTNEKLQAEFTGRYWAEESSRLAYAELTQIFDGAAEGICIVDCDRRIIRVNNAFCTLVGYGRDELVGQFCFDMFQCPSCDSPICPVSRILAGEELVEADKEMNRSDGTKVPCLMSIIPFRGPGGEPLGVAAFFKDISERKKAEELLRESEAKYSALVEQAQDGVAIIQDEVFKFVNTASASVTGYAVEELIGMPFLDILAPESREMAAWIYTLLLSGEKVPPLFEVKLICKDGNIKYGEVSSGLIQYHGKPGVMAITRDITDRKRVAEEKEKIQAQLIQAQKLEAIGLLAGGVAHDFNNLLTMIQGHATLALLEISEADPIEADPVEADPTEADPIEANSIVMDLNEIRTAAGRAANLTRQLLLFSRRQPTERVSLNLNSTVDELLKMIHRIIGEDVTINVDLEPDLWTVLADEGNIEQVIMNLVINARDAMPRGGELTIKTKNLSLDNEQAMLIPGASPGQFVCLSITDTGCGMSKEIMTRIFEPFFTTKEIGKGSGLGLSVVYGIIRQHEGWIHVCSEPGKGTEFAIYLPASFTVTETKVRESASVKKFQGKGEHILLVEDEEGVRKLTAIMLRENGYAVFAAANVQEALSIFGQERGNFDLLLSDVVLPGQTGIELADQLLLLRPTLRVLLISGYPNKQSQWAVIQERGFRFLHKPVSLLDLLRTIREIIEPGTSRESE